VLWLRVLFQANGVSNSTRHQKKARAIGLISRTISDGTRFLFLARAF
jgi:hypothetical protein